MLALAFSAAALRNHTYWGENGPGPAFLPFWLGPGDGACWRRCCWSARCVRATRADAWLPRGDGLRRLALVIGATVAFVVLLPLLGMALSTALFIVVLLRRLERHPWPLSLAVAAGVTAVNYLVFTYWLKVPFPVGVFGV